MQLPPALFWFTLLSLSSFPGLAESHHILDTLTASIFLGVATLQTMPSQDPEQIFSGQGVKWPVTFVSELEASKFPNLARAFLGSHCLLENLVLEKVWVSSLFLLPQCLAAFARMINENNS